MSDVAMIESNRKSTNRAEQGRGFEVRRGAAVGGGGGGSGRRTGQAGEGGAHPRTCHVSLAAVFFVWVVNRVLLCTYVARDNLALCRWRYFFFFFRVMAAI